MGFPGGSVVRNLPASAEDAGLKISWRKKWQPTPVFLPGKSHGQRSLAGYSPPGCKDVGYDLVAKQKQQSGVRENLNLWATRALCRYPKCQWYTTTLLYWACALDLPSGCYSSHLTHEETEMRSDFPKIKQLVGRRNIVQTQAWLTQSQHFSALPLPRCFSTIVISSSKTTSSQWVKPSPMGSHHQLGFWR